ncbi:peptidase [Arthrobacter crystallopoietes]|uniref:LPXTG cell wall anchor domain-containing protein n=1 Tax=Crystallibacter crystallopoietes TaxID=37928 RepID=UPI003D1CF5A2
MKKTLTALAIAGSLTFVGAGAAQAYVPDPATPAESPNVTINDNDLIINVGDVFIFSGSGFAPNEIIDITVTLVNGPNAVGSVGGFGVGGGVAAGVTGLIAPTTVAQALTDQADADGVFSKEITLSTPGTYNITATGQESGLTSSVRGIQVVNPGDSAVPGDPSNNPGGGIPAEDEVEDGNRLANTGLESSALLWGGAGILALGAGATAVVVARRKTAQ